MLRAPFLRSFAAGGRLPLAVMLTIAVGVATLTTTFGVARAALLRLPPFPEAARLAMLFTERRPPGEPPRQERWSFARFERLRATQRSFDLVASYSPASLTLATGTDAILIQAERISASYLPLLGAVATRGRLLSEADDDPAHPAAVALVSHGLWSGQLASDPDVIGRTIRLNGVTVTIVGVLAPGFAGLSGRASVWIPRTLSPQIAYAEYLTTNQNFIAAVGRLRPGVSLDSARRELAVLGAAINREIPSDPGHPDELVTATATSLNEARIDRSVRRSLLILFGAVVVLDVLACVNVINLLLGRAAARRREHAVRVALGIGTSRLRLEAFAEHAALIFAGGLAGVMLAWWATSAITPPASLWATFYGNLAPFDTPGFSSAELVFGLALALVTATAVAMAPAFVASRVNFFADLTTGSRSVSGNALSLRRPTIRGVIVGLEAALATLLVIAAGLLLNSVQRIRHADLGIDPDRVLTFWVIPSETRVPPATAPLFIDRLLDSVSQVPGVESVSVDGGGPLTGSASSTLYIAGRPAPGPGQAPPITRHYVGPDHFRTMGIPLKRGRVFSASDTANATRVAVISETAARQFWPGADPIGQRVWFGGGSDFDSPERGALIVGIVGDVRYQPFDRPANLASFYTPYKQFTFPARMVFVRTSADPMTVVPDVRRAVARVDPELALQDVRPLAELVSGSWARRRFDAVVFSCFGGLSLLLAATGLFAVLAQSVEARRREFGIRVALGAYPWRVIRHVLREGMVFPIAGLAVGVGASLALTRVLQSSLYETSPQEPRVFVSMMVVLLAASMLACLAPAWRATRANPIDALRSE